MRHCNEGRFRQQVRFLQQQYLQDGNLPFGDILSTELIGQTLTGNQGTWSGTAPIAYALQWQRCDAAGGSCVDLAGAGLTATSQSSRGTT